jgi:hypothetical protein
MWVFGLLTDALEKYGHPFGASALLLHHSGNFSNRFEKGSVSPSGNGRKH